MDRMDSSARLPDPIHSLIAADLIHPNPRKCYLCLRSHNEGEATIKSTLTEYSTQNGSPGWKVLRQAQLIRDRCVDKSIQEAPVTPSNSQKPDPSRIMGLDPSR